MKRIPDLIIVALILVVSGSCSGFLHRTEPRENVQELLSKPAGTDPDLITGTLPNGLVYYIRQNGEPNKRAELRLVVKAGSILEDTDQRGLAHFVEHMAFNGTGHFEKQELVDYLESIGMRFGPDLNAYTGFDETVYMLQIPTDSMSVVHTSFQVLEDWAHLISFDDGEIDRERGVIVEEWRRGRGADARIRDQELRVLFQGSRYADRLPIGEPQIIETFSHDRLRQFYRDWYRPDLMAVVAVGDFDPALIESLIREHFSYEANQPERPRPTYDVPGHQNTLYTVVSDPEATGSSVGLYILRGKQPKLTIGDFREVLTRDLFNALFNSRLDDLSRTENPPFLNAYSDLAEFTSTADFYILSAEVRDNGIEEGFRTVLTESERIGRYGFTASEIERSKTEHLRMAQQEYRERNRTDSSNFAARYVNHFLIGEFLFGLEQKYQLYRTFIPSITPEELNAVTDELITQENRVVLADGPRKEGVTLPDETALRNIFTSIAGEDISPYTDDFTERPLLRKSPSPGSIVREQVIPDMGVTEWNLANGIRVVLKPTDFKNDEVRFTSYSEGGYSLVPPQDYVPAMTAADIMNRSGVNDFSQIELQKLLVGRIVNVSPWIEELNEGISGVASPQDMESMFQLIYLYAASPRKDSTAFNSYRDRLKGYIENRNADPENALSDTIRVTLGDYSPWRRPWTIELLNELELDTSYDIYRDRFADMGDFTFFFVGNFTLKGIRPLVQTYLGGLPSAGRRETWRDLDIEPPQGVIEKDIRKGTEQVGRVVMVFTGPFDWNRQNRYTIQTMAGAFEIQLREVLRETLGGTYDISVGSSPIHYPDPEYQITIDFGCDPIRAEELTQQVLTEIENLKQDGPGATNLSKVKEMQRRQQEISLRDNSFWLSSLSFYYENREDPRQILELSRYIDTVSEGDIRDAADQYFDVSNYMTFFLYPESFNPEQKLPITKEMR